MNEQTKKCLKDFISEVEALAAGCYRMIGEASVKSIIDSAEKLKKQLDADETIP